ncbi:MAG: fibronectin type III domain-containing protein [Patescibacteria group bacterium]|nr:fibronectin type III domain-containing protein [Patescibacteria group bacterium]
MAKKNIIFSILLALIGVLISVNFALAENCPNITTVNGTTVTFVGEVTDMGGDITVSSWFEYGPTTNYGQTTSEKILTQQGIYCITVSNLSPCTTYHYRAVAKNSAGISYGEDKSFTTACGPQVDIKANGSDGPINLSYGSSANLSWTSTNANSCIASGSWSGVKGPSGSENTGSLGYGTYTYTLTCSGSAGSATDSVKINVKQVLGTQSPTIQKKGRNLSDGQAIFSKSIFADPSEILEFQIQVNSGSGAKNLRIVDVLPDKITFKENTLKIDGVLTSGNIAQGIDLGNLGPNQKKIITFWAVVDSADKFPFGQTNLTNSATLFWNGDYLSDSARITVSKTAVLGATSAPTGLTDNIFFDSLLLPFFIASILIWLFKSHILKWEEWLDKRKKEYRKFKSEKLLQLKISQIKAKESQPYF